MKKIPDVCVVACITGNRFKCAFEAPTCVDSYFFTNNDTLKTMLTDKGWKYVHLPFPLLDFRQSSIQSKFVKFIQFNKTPQFTKYRVIIYVDHKYPIANKHIPMLLSILGNNAIAIRLHNIERDLWGEFQESNMQPRYSVTAKRVSKFIAKQLKKTPEIKNEPICDTSLIVYNMTHDVSQVVANQVFRYVHKVHSPECQIGWVFAAYPFKEHIVTFKNQLLGLRKRKHQARLEKLRNGTPEHLRRFMTGEIVSMFESDFLTLLHTARRFHTKVEGDICYPSAAYSSSTSLQIFLSQKHWTLDELIQSLLQKQRNLSALSRKSNAALEIGFNAGNSAMIMLASNSGLHLTAVDICRHAYTELCATHIAKKYPLRFTFLRGDSTVVVPKLTATYDLIHVDGCHRPKIAQRDLENSHKLLRTGGVMLFDDTDYQPLNQLVNTFVRTNNYTEVKFPHFDKGLHHRAFIKH